MNLAVNEISKQIYHVREVQVMLDSDLAHLFQTETRTLNQTVRRNMKRFPKDLMFQLSKDEFKVLKSQNVISKKETRGGCQKLPLVFTELGVGMISCILNNDRAIQVSISVMRAFAQIRQTSDAQIELVKKVNSLEQGFREFSQAQIQAQARLESKFDAQYALVQNICQRFKVQKLHSEGVSRRTLAGSPLIREVESIQDAVAKYFGLTIGDLKVRTRIKSTVIPRQIAIYLIRKRTQMSFKDIGSCFGVKDHTTILHACRKISAEITRNSVIREAVTKIEESLQHQTNQMAA